MLERAPTTRVFDARQELERVDHRLRQRFETDDRGVQLLECGAWIERLIIFTFRFFFARVSRRCWPWPRLMLGRAREVERIPPSLPFCLTSTAAELLHSFREQLVDVLDGFLDRFSRVVDHAQHDRARPLVVGVVLADAVEQVVAAENLRQRVQLRSGERSTTPTASPATSIPPRSRGASPSYSRGTSGLRLRRPMRVALRCHSRLAWDSTASTNPGSCSGDQT